MASDRALRQDFVDDLLSALSTAAPAMEAAGCCLCYEAYGKPFSEGEADAISWQELPYNDTFMPEVVEPIATFCGHQFCILCISMWLQEHGTCPMCRQPIDLPDHSDESEDDRLSAQIEGFMHVYQVSESRAREACNTYRLNTRQLLTTRQRMPIVWSPVNMVFNLPKAAVTIARRFHYKSIGQPAPSDLS